jgi:multimeric flavodoxin WrbA
VVTRSILGIQGSPRLKGNTSILLDAVLDGAREHGASVERVDLAGLDIRECDGCLACWKGKDCPKQDDMNGLYPKIIEADAIVFGTPVYWYGPTALLKAFVDRFVYFNCPENRAKVRGMSAAIVVPFEETDPDTVAPVITFFEKSFAYLEWDLVGRVIAPGVGKLGEVRERSELLEEARELGARLAATRERCRSKADG